MVVIGVTADKYQYNTRQLRRLVSSARAAGDAIMTVGYGANVPHTATDECYFWKIDDADAFPPIVEYVLRAINPGLYVSKLSHWIVFAQMVVLFFSLYVLLSAKNYLHDLINIRYIH